MSHSVVKYRLPSLPVLRERFVPDFENGILHYKPGFSVPGKPKSKTIAGSAGKEGRRFVGIHRRQFAVARVLWKMYTCRDPGALYVDHINGDHTDDRICNLRAVTAGENRMNSKVAAKSGHKGVYMIKLRSGKIRYRVQVCRVLGEGPKGEKRSRDGRVRKTYSYGTYETLEEAVERYEQVKKEWGMTPFTRNERMHTEPNQDSQEE